MKRDEQHDDRTNPARNENPKASYSGRPDQGVKKNTSTGAGGATEWGKGNKNHPSRVKSRPPGPTRLMTALLVASVPVPEVVGTAMKGTLRPSCGVKPGCPSMKRSTLRKFEEGVKNLVAKS